MIFFNLKTTSQLFLLAVNLARPAVGPYLNIYEWASEKFSKVGSDRWADRYHV